MTTSKAITKTPEQKAVSLAAPVGDANTLASLVTQAEERMVAASGGVLDIQRIARLQVLTRMAAKRVPQLLQCTRESFFWAFLDAARCGLEWDGEHGALVPYKNEAKFLPMYKGLIDLAAQESGAVVSAFPVYKGEHFIVHLGTDMRVEHRMALDVNRDDANVIAAYAVFQLPDGRKVFDVLSRAEIDKRKAVSKAATRDDSPWAMWYAEKAKVTVIKHGAKLLPKVSDRFRAAMEIDNRAETDGAPLSKEETPQMLPSEQQRGTGALLAQLGATTDAPTLASDEQLQQIDDMRKALKLSFTEAVAITGQTATVDTLDVKGADAVIAALAAEMKSRGVSP